MKKYVYIEDGKHKAEELVVTGGGSGYIFVTGVSSSGNISDLTYVADTVPANRVVESCILDVDDITIGFLVEGGPNYSPTVNIGADFCTNLQQEAGDQRLFSGTITTDVLETTDVLLESSTGQTTTVEINRAPEPPAILDIRFVNGYPGTQSEVKGGDVVDIQLTFDTNETEPVSVDIQSGGVCVPSTIPLTGYDHQVGVIIVSATVAYSNNTPTAKSVSATPKNVYNSVGLEVSSLDGGDLGDTISTLVCNETVPSFINNGTTYPLNQEAFKDIEVGSQNTQVSNYTSLLYSSVTGEFDISNPALYEQEKTITCTSPGTYNDNSTNFTITANRSDNDTARTFNINIDVADTVPHITVTQNSTRLRSSASGNISVITITSTQDLLSTPDLNIPVSGTWDDPSFTGGPKQYTRDIKIYDTDATGLGPWTFNGVPTNKAGTNATISGFEVVGGFVARNLTLKAFLNEISVDCQVTDYTKLRITSWSYTGVELTRAAVINTDPPVPGEFTIDQTGINPHIFRVLDTNKTNASSQDSTIYGYEEVV